MIDYIFVLEPTNHWQHTNEHCPTPTTCYSIKYYSISSILIATSMSLQTHFSVFCNLSHKHQELSHNLAFVGMQFTNKQWRTNKLAAIKDVCVSHQEIQRTTIFIPSTSGSAPSSLIFERFVL